MFGSVNHKTYVMFFYILVCMIMLIPAAVAAIFAIATQALPLALGMGLICVINVGVAALAVFLCRNMLNDGRRDEACGQNQDKLQKTSGVFRAADHCRHERAA